MLGVLGEAVKRLQVDVKELKADVKELKADLKGMNRKLDNVVVLVGLQIVGVHLVTYFMQRKS